MTSACSECVSPAVTGTNAYDAGKTTTLRILRGLLKADAGRAILLGDDPWRDAVELHGPGTFGLDRSPGWTVSSHWRTCIQQLTAGPGAACVLAAARAGIGVPSRTKAPAGRDGWAWLS